ncbi:MAG: Efflux transporter, RND family, MFP subunit [uncultured bacterium]|nr:MAG: Efflux transporter, RND family, MFP subunit [uncultured bacterium]HBH18971.1 efflux RND transporter periplasmic adaptor subunit [Cyanobacteria bacterium UBA9579]
MKKRDFIIISIIGLITISGAIIYYSKAGLISKDTKNPDNGSIAKVAHDHNNSLNSFEQTNQSPNTENASPSLILPELPTLEIPYDKQQLIGVKTVKASINTLDKIIRTVGRVSYDETKLTTINTKFEGYIEKLYVNYTGQYVKKGQAIAEIYSPELLSSQMEFINLLKWNDTQTQHGSDDNLNGMLSNDAKNIAEAAKQRLRLFGVTETQIQQIEKTKQPRRTLTIYSPANGFVIQKQALEGTRIMPGQALFDIADLSTVWILADVYEQEIPLIQSGQIATVSLKYFPGKTFLAKIDYVYPVLDNVTRTAKLRFTIPNHNGILKPQMYTDIEIAVGLGDRLSVPESAVINTGTRQIVYVDMGNGNFQQRAVITGQKANGLVEIQKGLKSGEVVATSANFLIDSEARLKGLVN